MIARTPAYGGGSIVNLISSVIAAAGGEAAYPPLDRLDGKALEPARHIVLLVADGLGADLLAAAPGAAALRAAAAGSITSVFPPTTATAVTALLTGLAPQQHGLTGWFMFFRALGSVISVLPFTTRLGRTSLASAGVDAGRLLGHTPVFDLVPRRCYSVAPADIAGSAFNRAHTGRAIVRPYSTMEELFAALEAIVREREPSFTYAYWPEIDRVAHVRGPQHAAVRAEVERLDRAFERFVARARGTGTATIVTADHGFVAVEPGRVIRLAEHPLLKQALVLPLCGEPRTAYCYVAPGREDEFAGYVQSELAHAALCVPSEALIEHGLFGVGAEHPELRSRIGTHTLIMRGGYAIADELPGERPFDQRGVHGGGSLAEMEVPLVVALP